jgi:hypothetical protein
MKAIGEAIASFWGRSALLLWCLSVCAIVALAVLWVATHFQIDGAAELFQSYGVLLALACVLLPIVASFKTYSEWPNPSLVLLPIADQCVWAQGPPRDGKVITQFGIRFQAANMSDGAIMLSEIVLRRPWVRRRSIIVRDLMFEDPNSHYYGHERPVPAQSLSYGSATIIVDHPVGRKGKPIRLVVSLRDHAGQWHKLVVPFVRSIG